MRYATDRIAVILLAALTLSAFAAAESLREGILKDRAKESGLVPATNIIPYFSPAKSAAGKLLFESKKLSVSKEVACQTCHLDRFGSADGIPNAVGTGGRGEGLDRVIHGGDILPRKTLPVWGRGSKGFDVFFWDGRVDKSDGMSVKSQFAANAPSTDPLVVAALLPMVEIREMVPDVTDTNRSKTETLESALEIYRLLEKRVQSDLVLSDAIAEAYQIESRQITIKHVAECLADFLRDRFRLRETKFHRFVFGDGKLSVKELTGGLLFYGKARCSTCHNGPFFSDLNFHAIPFGQLGFGKNGFGIDYGRFNVTLNPADRHKFRTPPLFNVAKTAPYSHSGVTYDLATAIRAHTDPLAVADVTDMTGPERVEFYKRLAIWTREPTYQVYLNEREIDDLVTFLGSLEFDPEE